MSKLVVHEIDRLDLPELQPYRTMRLQMEHRRQQIFVAEGEKVVRRLLESRFGVLSLLLPARWMKEYEPLIQARAEPEIHAYVAEKELLENLVGFPMYQGVLGLGKIPEAASLDEIIERSPRPLLLAAVDGLSNAENVGVVVRNCAALNAHALITSETSSSPYLRRAVRNSMGSLFRLPVVEVIGLDKTLARLRERGIRCVAAHPHTDKLRLSQCDLRGDCCIVFGSEGGGISALALAQCDVWAAIPMPEGVDSLNVNAAAAAFLYEASRQRGLV